jgi:cytoskeletal protein RodZ
MTSFLRKKITNIQTLGEKLIKHRQSKGLSQDKAAKLININVRYIKNFEKNNYKALPADVYATNILKRYAKLLDLNPTTVVELFDREKKLYFKTQKQKQIKEVRWWHKIANFFLNPKFLKYSIFLIVLLAVLYYIGSGINKIISPPMLVVETPVDNLITSDHQITIQGTTEKEVTLAVNNRPILSDKDGRFNVTLDLQRNLNIIKISAKKKHSKEQIIYRKIIVNDTE